MNKPLSNFLKSKRSSISPEKLGITITNRRKVKGLKREEVAQLSHISTSWYTWLEQGKHINASEEVLNAISTTLQMDYSEKVYFFKLVKGPPYQNIIMENTIPISLEKSLNEMSKTPVIITDRYFHLLYFNKRFLDIFLLNSNVKNQNFIKWLFECSDNHSFNSDTLIESFLSILKSYYGHYLDDPWYEEFIKKMSQQYVGFRESWNKVKPNKSPNTVISAHNKGQNLYFTLNSLKVYGNKDLRCTLFSPYH